MKHHADLDLNLGASSVELEIPPTLSTELRAETALGSVSVRGFKKEGKWYLNQAALKDTNPQLSIRAKMAVGSLAVHSE
jgi:hypothetical protein